MIDFPDNPNVGQLFVGPGGLSWRWDGDKWGQVTIIASAGVPSIWTPGSVAFATNTTTIGEDNTNLFWDDVNNRLGVATNVPLTRLHVNGNIIAGQAAGSFASPTYPTTNLVLYANSAANWSGIGADGDGTMYFVTGTTAPATRLNIDPTGRVNVSNNKAGIYNFNVISPSINNSAWGPADYIAGFRNTHNAAGDHGLVLGVGAGGPDSASILAVFVDGSGTLTPVGSITRNGLGVLYNTTSDRRLKGKLAETQTGLDTLMQLKVRDFTFTADPDRIEQGFVAQELHEIYPSAVHAGGDDPAADPWGLDYGRLTPLLVKAVQDLAARLAEIEKQLP